MLLSDIKNVVASAEKWELRKFGITIGVFLLAVAAFLFCYGKSSAEYIACIGAGFLIIALTLPIILKPIYIVWMSFAVIMGFIMSRVILTIIFGLVFTPTGLIIRLIGKDPLKERIDPQVETYWIARESDGFDAKSVENQY